MISGVISFLNASNSKVTKSLEHIRMEWNYAVEFISGDICKIIVFTSSTPPPHCRIKEPGIHTPSKWLLWDINLPSSWSTGFPNKIVFLASIPHFLAMLNKKIHNLIIVSEFYLGQNEDWSPEVITSDRSEKLLQRGHGGRSLNKILVKGQLNAIKCLLYKRFFLLVTRIWCHHEGI